MLFHLALFTHNAKRCSRKFRGPFAVCIIFHMQFKTEEKNIYACEEILVKGLVLFWLRCFVTILSLWQVILSAASLSTPHWPCWHCVGDASVHITTETKIRGTRTGLKINKKKKVRNSPRGFLSKLNDKKRFVTIIFYFFLYNRVSFFKFHVEYSWYLQRVMCDALLSFLCNECFVFVCLLYLLTLIL